MNATAPTEAIVRAVNRARKQVGIAALAAIVACSLQAAPADPVQMPDASLRYCVEVALDKAGGATITEADMASLSKLSCSSRRLAEEGLGKVVSLAGLEFAVDLSRLQLTSHAVSDLSPLANLVSLTELWLGANAVSDVSPLARLTALTSLNLGVNAVSDISPLAGLASLDYLGLYDNAVVDVSALRGLAALGSLYLQNNRISDISPLAANAGLDDGDYVELQGNPLDANAHDTHLPTLQGRGVTVYFDPRTTEADIPDAALRGCVERALDKEAGESIGIEELAALTSLTCRNARVSDLSGVSAATSLAELDLRDNVIADISALAANSGLGAGDAVDLRGNPLNAAARDTHIPALRDRGVSIHFDKPAPPVAIADAALRHCVERALRKGAGATITEDDMAALSRLHCRLRRRADGSIDPAHHPHGAVASLAGLEFAANLSLLNLNGNAISDISPLADLVSLADLNIDGNAISDISPLAGLSSLTSLGLSGNAASDLSPLAGLSSLRVLRLVGGNVSDISPLAKLVSLTELWLGANAVTDVSPLVRLTALTKLDLGANAVTDISPLAGLASLDYLGLYSNTIADVSALRGLGTLRSLYLANNQISDISPLAANAGLDDGDYVELQGNPLDANAHDTHIPTLQGRGVTVYFDPPVAEADIPDAALRGCVEQALDKEAGESIGIEELAALTSLTCRNARVSDLSGVSAATSLAELDLRDNVIADISPLAANSGLGAGDAVDLRGNPLNTAARDTHIPALRDRGVSIHFDKPAPPVAIADAALRHCVEQALRKGAGATITEDDMAALSRLHCKLRRRADGSIDPAHHPHGAVASLAGLEFAANLSLLNLNGNAISDISPLADLVSLADLNIDGNAISDISPLAGLSSLTSLGLSGNAASDLSPLAGLSSLRVLRLVGGNVSDLSPLAKLVSLTELWLGANAVSDVSPLARLTALTKLDLGANAVTDISPLAGLASLDYLGLYSNTIADVSALRGLGTLRSLYLANNQISDISPLVANAALGDGDYIELQGNRIGCGTQARHVRVLRDRGATVYADAADLSAPPGFAVTAGDGSVELHWQAPEACHVVRYEVRHGVGQVPEFGPWREITGPWREVVDTGKMRHTVGSLANGLLHTFELRAIGVDDAGQAASAGQAARSSAFLAESPDAPVAIEDVQLNAGIMRALGKTVRDQQAGRVAPSASSQSGAGQPAVTQGEMATLTELDLRATGVVDLAGLEHALNLRSLMMSGNRVSNLDPIVGLRFLSSLDLSANGLVDISALSGMRALERLWLNDNHIVDIWPLAANTELGEGDIRPDGSSDYVDLRGNPLNSEGIEKHVPSLRERGAAVLLDDAAHLLPVFTAAGNHWRESFARIVNPTDQDGEVRVTAVDESGNRAGPVLLPVGSGRTVHFNSVDLESGNAEKDLSGVGAGSGAWRLELRSVLPIEVFAYMRHTDGLVTSMTAWAPEAYAQHRIPTFNPGSNANQTSRLRLVNPANKTARVLIEGVDDRGATASVALTVPAGATREFTAAALEQGVGDGIADGGLGDGAGKWRLTATSFDGVRVLNVLDSPAGHRANLSIEPGDSDGRVHHLPLFPAAASPAREGFVRIVNRSPRAGKVRIRAFNVDGNSAAAGTLALDALGAIHFNSRDLENGNAGKGLTGVAAAQEDWRLELRSDVDVGVQGYVRAADGFVDSIHAIAPVTAAGAHRVAFFNPARDSRQASRLRMVNLGDTPANVRVSGTDDDGNPGAAAVRLTIPANATRELTARDLETGEAVGVAGALGEGSGKWRLLVESAGALAVMSLVENDSGQLTNLSR